MVILYSGRCKGLLCDSQTHLNHEIVSAVHAYCDAAALPIAKALAKLTRIQCELLGRRAVPRYIIIFLKQEPHRAAQRSQSQ